MWFSKKTEQKINCFFCKIEVKNKNAYKLEYKTKDGIFTLDICPMCEGMMSDIMKVYNHE